MRFELVGQQNATLLGNRWDPLLAIALVRDLVHSASTIQPTPQGFRNPGIPPVRSRWRQHGFPTL